MTDAQIIELIRAEVARAANVILYGLSGENDGKTETVEQLFPLMPNLTERPVFQPYGLSSRAPKGTKQVVGRMGHEVSNRAVLSHFDQNRPVDYVEGETVLYNEFGQRIYLLDGEIHIGSKAASEPLVLGNIFRTFMQDFLEAFITHTHEGNLGFPTGVPLPPALTTAEELKVSPIDDRAILSDECFTEKTNQTDLE